jgi:Uma2 family endonuclease
MATLVRIDPETLPRVLILDPPVSDAEFETLCRDNPDLRLERTREGAVRMNPPTGGWTSSGNSEISGQLYGWWAKRERGRIFDSNGGFRLPDGSTLSPDAAYLSEERLRALAKGELRSFPRVCPDFVIELLSETDSLAGLRAKMDEWIANGAQLAWMIDPYRREAWVYRPGSEAYCVASETLAGEGPVEGFELNLARVWKRFED